MTAASPKWTQGPRRDFAIADVRCDMMDVGPVSGTLLPFTFRPTKTALNPKAGMVPAFV